MNYSKTTFGYKLCDFVTWTLLQETSFHWLEVEELQNQWKEESILFWEKWDYVGKNKLKYNTFRSSTLTQTFSASRFLHTFEESETNHL